MGGTRRRLVGEREKPGHFSWTHFAAGQQLRLHSSSFPGKSLPHPQLLLGDFGFCSLITHPIPITLQQRGGNSFLTFPISALLHNPLLYFSTLPPSVQTIPCTDFLLCEIPAVVSVFLIELSSSHRVYLNSNLDVNTAMWVSKTKVFLLISYL